MMIAVWLVGRVIIAHLHRLGEGARDAIRVDGVAVQPFRFKPDHMRVASRKALHLVAEGCRRRGFAMRYFGAAGALRRSGERRGGVLPW